MTSLILMSCILLVASLLFSRRKWYAPAVLSMLVWFVVFVAYSLIDKGMHPFKESTVLILSTWMIVFCVSTWIAQSIYVKPLLKDVRTSVVARDIYYYFSLLSIPFLIFDVVMVIRHASMSNVFTVLRDANVSENSQGIRTTGFFVIFWLVSFLMELQVANRKNMGRLLLLLLLNLLYVVVSMGKINLLILGLSSLIVLSKKGVVKFKHLICVGLIMCVAFVGIQSMRGAYSSMEKFAALYLTSSVANLNTHLEPKSAERPCENTFRIYYAIKSKLDGGKTIPVDTNLKFYQIPIGKHTYWSNTYTVLYPFYVDFGSVGVVIFAIFLGLFYGYLFKTSEDNSSYALILYSILSSSIVLHFFADTFFMILSQTIQYIIVALIPFVISKYNLFASYSKKS